jgi:hypothetical protein
VIRSDRSKTHMCRRHVALRLHDMCVAHVCLRVVSDEPVIEAGQQRFMSVYQYAVRAQ